jgi:hypothetical protein
MKLDLPFNVTYYKNSFTDRPVGLFPPGLIVYRILCIVKNILCAVKFITGRNPTIFTYAFF